MELQSHSSTSGTQSSSTFLAMNTISTETAAKESITVNSNTKEKESINESLSKRYCSGCIGVPITVLDKYNPEQLEIVKFRKGDDGKDLTYESNKTRLNKQTNKQQTITPYFRIIVRKIL